MKQCGFNGMQLFEYSVCRTCTHFVFIANCVIVYGLLPVELLIIEHLISLPVHKKMTQSKSCTEFKKTWTLYTLWMLQEMFLTKESQKNLAFLYKLEMQGLVLKQSVSEQLYW